jgi:hypothetical protein
VSHFTTIKTQFVSRDHLKQALEDVREEFGLGEVRYDAVVNGFGGGTTPAELVVSTRNRGYDIGFRKEGETYGLVADWYGIRDVEQEQLKSRLGQRYAYQVVREKLDQQGFSLIEEEVQENRAIHLTVRRAV